MLDFAEVLLHGASSTEVRAGQTVFIAQGARFQPTFPEATEYIPVCLPAFRPDRCIREEEPGGAVSAKLKELHGGYNAVVTRDLSEDPAPEVMYHMCLGEEMAIFIHFVSFKVWEVVVGESEGSRWSILPAHFREGWWLHSRHSCALAALRHRQSLLSGWKCRCFSDSKKSYKNE